MNYKLIIYLGYKIYYSIKKIFIKPPRQKDRFIY